MTYDASVVAIRLHLLTGYSKAVCIH